MIRENKSQEPTRTRIRFAEAASEVEKIHQDL